MSALSGAGASGDRGVVHVRTVLTRQDDLVVCSFERKALVRSELYAKILRQYSPSTLAIELSHPLDIGRVSRKFVAKRDKFMGGI